LTSTKPHPYTQNFAVQSFSGELANFQGFDNQEGGTSAGD
jgi:hypothetical protein